MASKRSVHCNDDRTLCNATFLICGQSEAKIASNYYKIYTYIVGRTSFSEAETVLSTENTKHYIYLCQYYSIPDRVTPSFVIFDTQAL